jgi:hypothetical protein
LSSRVAVVAGIFMAAAQVPVDFAQAQGYPLPLERITPLPSAQAAQVQQLGL